MLSNILILSAGRRVSLTQSFLEAVKELNLPSKVLTADLCPHLAPACHIAPSRKLPHVLSDDYPQALLNLCQHDDVALVIPTIDPELKVLARLRDDFAIRGISLIVSSLDLVERSSDKRLTPDLFNAIGLSTPQHYHDAPPCFPLFVKPIFGSMSIGAQRIETPEHLSQLGLTPDTHVFMEALDLNVWEEVTVDAYYDCGETLKGLVPRHRLEVRGGEISKGWTDKALLPLLKPALDKLQGARGVLCVQAFVHRSSHAILASEINARFGGGYPLSHKAGANFSAWLLREYLLGQPLDYNEDWTDRLLMLRFDSQVWATYPR